MPLAIAYTHGRFVYHFGYETAVTVRRRRLTWPTK
jgi:hypothetical protein